jgi:hypothetical protein
MGDVVAIKKVLTVEEMLSADDIEFDEVAAFGGTVRIGSIDAGKMIEFQEAQNTPAKKNAGLRLIIESIVNEKGERLGNWPVDLQRWKTRSQKTCERLVAAILKLNGMGDAAKKALSAAVRTLVAEKLATELATVAGAPYDQVVAVVNRVIDEAVGADAVKNG